MLLTIKKEAKLRSFKLDNSHLEFDKLSEFVLANHRLIK